MASRAAGLPLDASGATAAVSSSNLDTQEPLDMETDDASAVMGDDDDDDDTLAFALAFVDAFEAPALPVDATVAPLSESDCEWSADASVDTIAQLVPSTSRAASAISGVRKQQQAAVTKKTIGGGGSCGGGSKLKVPGSTNKARDSRKEELIYLRRKVTELEQLLADCRRRQPTICAAPPSRASRPTGQQPRRTPLEPSVWQEISDRQYAHRAKAERENIRLKLVLENQLKIAKGLEKMLHKTTSTKEFDRILHGEQRPRWSLDASPVPSQEANARLFDELLGGLDQSYVETEAVFEANGLAGVAGSAHIDAVIRPDERSGILVEVFASKVLPFDMRAAGAVVWNHYAFAKERLPNRAYRHNSPQVLNATEDTLIEDFNLEIDLNNAIALYRVRLVLRRYTEETRVVIVWRAFADTLQIADERTDGARFLERGYIVIREANPSASSSSSRQPLEREREREREPREVKNVLQTCYLMTPVSNGMLAGADSSKIGKVTDFVIAASAANISATHEIIESVLLEQAMKAQWGRAAASS